MPSDSLSTAKVADAATLFCALLTVLNAFSTGIHTAPAHIMRAVLNSATGSSTTGMVWNMTDSVSGLAAAPQLFREAEKSILNPHDKMVLAWINAAHFGVVLPAFSAWGFATTIKSIEAVGAKALIYSGGATVGAAAALAGSAFAFAAGMFVSASISGYAWFRALQPDAPLTMLEDKITEFDEFKKNIEKITAEIGAVRRKKLSHENERKELDPLEQKLDVLIVKQNQVKADIELLYACALDRKTPKPGAKIPAQLQDATKKIEDKVSKVLGVKRQAEIKSTYRQLATKGESLIQKQIEIKRQETIANTIGGVGAILGGLALLLPPAAIPLLAASAVCFAVCAVMKGVLWFKGRETAKKAEPAVLAAVVNNISDHENSVTMYENANETEKALKRDIT